MNNLLSGVDKRPNQLKSGTVPVFNLNLILKNKTQRQTHIALYYIVVQYHIAPHPPFKNKIFTKTVYIA